MKGALEGLDYVKKVEVVFDEKIARLTVVPDKLNRQEVIKSIEKAGFTATFEEE